MTHCVKCFMSSSSCSTRPSCATANTATATLRGSGRRPQLESAGISGIFGGKHVFFMRVIWIYSHDDPWNVCFIGFEVEYSWTKKQTLLRCFEDIYAHFKWKSMIGDFEAWASSANGSGMCWIINVVDMVFWQSTHLLLIKIIQKMIEHSK
jgi:hypothetical protein